MSEFNKTSDHIEFNSSQNRAEFSDKCINVAHAQMDCFMKKTNKKNEELTNYNTTVTMISDNAIAKLKKIEKKLESISNEYGKFDKKIGAFKMIEISTGYDYISGYKKYCKNMNYLYKGYASDILELIKRLERVKENNYGNK